MPRAAQRSTGSSTTRRAVVEVADHLVAGDEREAHDRLEVPRRAAVDGGQVAAADAGQAGPDPLPLGPGQRRLVDVGQPQRPDPGARRRCATPTPPGRPRSWGSDRSNSSAFIGRARRGGLGPIGSSGRGPPGAFGQCSTCQPRLRAMAASLASGLTATGMADGLEHGQVAGRVGVGDRLCEVEAVGLGVVGHDQGPGLAGRRAPRQLAGEAAVAARRGEAQTMSSKSGRSGSITKSRAPVISRVRWPSAAVLAHPADPGRERLGQDQVAEQLPRVVAQPLDRGALVAAVEVAQEVAPVLAVEGQQAGRLAQGAQREADPVARRRGAGWPARRRTRPRWRRSACSPGRTRPAGARGRARPAGPAPRGSARSSRRSGGRPAVVRTRAWSTTDGRWTSWT